MKMIQNNKPREELDALCKEVLLPRMCNARDDNFPTIGAPGLRPHTTTLACWESYVERSIFYKTTSSIPTQGTGKSEGDI
jgi:hypothetical protein